LINNEVVLVTIATWGRAVSIFVMLQCAARSSFIFRHPFANVRMRGWKRGIDIQGDTSESQYAAIKLDNLKRR
jgi:hypothetical protein